MRKFAQFTHPIYKSATSLQTADAVGWAFVTKEKVEPIAFNFPAIAKDEVRANVNYCGLCHTDTLMSRSQWFDGLDYPIIPGHEIIGEVSQVGSEITNFKKGDKVGFGFLRDHCGKCKYCKIGKENLCVDGSLDKAVFGHHFGGFATSIQQPGKWFFKLPEKMEMEKAGPLLCAGITVFAPIKRWIKPGDKCAVLGIGGLGHMAVQYLAKMGHHVTAFNNHLDYADLMHKLGAKECVNTTDDVEYAKHHNQYDFILNTIPYGKVFPKFLDLCAPSARFVQVGLPDKGEPLTVPHIPLVFKEVALVGSIVGNLEDNRAMIDFSYKNHVYPMCEEYAFEDFEKAIETIEHGKPRFRIVLNIKDYARKNNLHKL